MMVANIFAVRVSLMQVFYRLREALLVDKYVCASKIKTLTFLSEDASKK